MRSLPVLLLLLLPLRAGEPLSLEDAIDLALTRNRSLLNLQSGIADARLEAAARAAEFRLTPGLRSTAGRGESIEQAEAGLELRQRTLTGADLSLFGGIVINNGTETTRLRLRATQPLLQRAGPLVTREPLTRAERGVLDARRAAFERKQSLILDVVVAYESILRAARQIDADEHTLDRLQSLARLTRARGETGQVSRIDVLRMDLQLGEAETRLQNSRDILQTLREEFAILLGLDPARHFTLLPPPLLELEPPEPDEAFTLALTRRIDIARALAALDDADRTIRIARRSLLPDVRLLGEIDAGGEDTDLQRESWFVGFTIEPDFNPVETRGEVDRARLRRERIERQTVDLHHAVQRDVRRQLRDLRRTRANLTIAARNRELTEKRLRLAEALFRMGRGDAVTLSDAEDAHTLATTAELSARTDASLAAYRLLFVLGTLLEPPPELLASP